MPDVSNWRSASAYAYLDDLDTAGLAWEALRRNDDYARDRAKALKRVVNQSRRDHLCRHRWGLRFRDGSQSILAVQGYLLGA